MDERQLTNNLRIQPATLVRLRILSAFMAVLLVAGSADALVDTKSRGAELTIKITYVGNEGVLIQGKEKKVLIDGLHREYKPAYHHLSETQIRKAEKGIPPFNDIDLLLVTHIHRDHFSAESVGRYLKNNPATVLIGSRQVVDSLKEEFSNFQETASRVKEITPAFGTAESVTVDGVDVQILRLAHTRKQHQWVEHLGFLVTIDGETVLHIGDAAMESRQFAQFSLTERTIDIACLPSWFFVLKAGQDIIRNQIQANYLIGIHIDQRNTEHYSKSMKEAFPNVVPMINLFSVFPDSF